MVITLTMEITGGRRRRRRGWRSSDDYKEPEEGNFKIEEVDSCRSSDADDNGEEEEKEDYSNVDEDGGNNNECKADCKASYNIVSGDDSFYIPPIVLFDCLFLFPSVS